MPSSTFSLKCKQNTPMHTIQWNLRLWKHPLKHKYTRPNTYSNLHTQVQPSIMHANAPVYTYIHTYINTHKQLINKNKIWSTGKETLTKLNIILGIFILFSGKPSFTGTIYPNTSKIHQETNWIRKPRRREDDSNIRSCTLKIWEFIFYKIEW